MKHSAQELLDQQMDAVNTDILEFMDAVKAGKDTFGEDDQPLDEYALEVVREMGQPYAVVICTGGPHIEVAAEGPGEARLEGYWWGTRSTYYGKHYSDFMDWWIEDR